jgi:hypothetical protein
LVLAHENKCAMCGKAFTIRGHLHNNNNQQESHNQQQNSSATIIVEQIDGSSYTFDTADCALMFKKFMVYMEAILLGMNNNKSTGWFYSREKTNYIVFIIIIFY